jgi:hypothetical protein
MPRIQKRKQFPFFSLPEPKFLTRKLKKIDDFVVLVRVTPNISIFNYVDSIVYLLIFVLASLTLIFSWLAYAFSKAPSLLFTFLWHDGWMLFASVYAGYSIPWMAGNGRRQIGYQRWRKFERTRYDTLPQLLQRCTTNLRCTGHVPAILQGTISYRSDV